MWLSTLTAFAIGFGMTILVGASKPPLTKMDFLLAAITGVVVAAKDMRSYKKLPPIEEIPSNEEKK